MSTLGDPPPVAEMLAALRATVADTPYPLALPGAAEARAARRALLSQLDDYLLPRLARPDAPLLAVVGGSTGAGKSTLVNTLVEAPVTPAGVLRPTTRAPVLVTHPNDTAWFRRPHVLPGLVRTSSAPATPDSLHLVSAHALIPGLALLDAPDIDSVVDGNRVLAGQLLAAADLWIFVTTAARYADAVPWGLLDTAQNRGTAVALVLDRVPREAADEVSAHFDELLAAHGLGNAPLFVIPETMIDGQGLLPERAVAPLRTWLNGLARDVAARDAVVRRTVAGALTATAELAQGLAAAADNQVAAAQELTDRVRLAYQAAFSAVAGGVLDGTPLRGEVLARWQEFVSTGELFTALQASRGGLRDQIVTTVTGRRAPGGTLKAAITSSLAKLVSWAATDAAEQAAASWRAHPAGTALLTAAGSGASPGLPESIDLGRPSEDLAWRAGLLVSEWQRGLLRLVRAGVAGERANTRAAAYAVNATRLLVMIGMCSATTTIPTGLDVAVAGGRTVAARRLLETVFDDQGIRDLATTAREDLLARVRALLDEEEQRYLEVVAAARVREEPAARLWEGAQALTLAAMAPEPAEPPAEPEPAEPPAEPEPAEPPAEPEPEPVKSRAKPAARSRAKPAAAEPEPEPERERERMPVSVPVQRTRRKARRRAS